MDWNVVITVAKSGGFARNFMNIYTHTGTLTGNTKAQQISREDCPSRREESSTR